MYLIYILRSSDVKEFFKTTVTRIVAAVRSQKDESENVIPVSRPRIQSRSQIVTTGNSWSSSLVDFPQARGCLQG